ncbi:DUF6252 family protein [Flavobacterium sp. LS1R47]|jgi:hypothetical protein|uniref:DUF6252 family protein n=1 Tax=Flavobacterium frigoritolerans TaxID=2987686 RepID=A0A9X3C265_9FLAO|nr:DUF6252 family protein [Flavobacterium frigoritolerans]MCV9933656.1 DUF6252 family protein [Flavobacterium frigoritolerans]
MKKWFLLLPLVLLLFSCDKEGVETNNVINTAFQSLRNETFWKATSYSASVDGEGKLVIIGGLNNDKVVLQTASVNAQTYTLGVDDVSTATYINSLSKKEVLYKTGKELGSGQIVITEYNKVTNTVSGTFSFVAPDSGDVMSVEKAIRFKEGVFYKVPVILVSSSE